MWKVSVVVAVEVEPGSVADPQLSLHRAAGRLPEPVDEVVRGVEPRARERAGVGAAAAPRIFGDARDPVREAVGVLLQPAVSGARLSGDLLLFGKLVALTADVRFHAPDPRFSLGTLAAAQPRRALKLSPLELQAGALLGQRPPQLLGAFGSNPARRVVPRTASEQLA